MDIKPVKRRKRPVGTQRMLQNGAADNKATHLQKNIILKSKNSRGIRAKNKPSIINIFKINMLPIAALAFLCVLYFPASRLLNGSGQYQDLLDKSSSFNVILDDISFAPQKIFIFAAQSIGIGGSFLLKACMFSLSIFAVYLFYKACRLWFGKNTALLTALLFASSGWMILSSQSLVFNNIYLLFFPLVIYLNDQFSREKNSFKIFLAVFAFAVVLYSPGMVWPALGLILLIPFFMQKIITKYDTGHMWVALMIIAALILPLLSALVLRPSNFSTILVGSGHITPAAFIDNLKTSLQALFINGLPDSNLWLVGTPILNFLTGLLVVFGAFYMIARRNLSQHLNFLVLSLVFSFLTLAFVGLEAIPLIIPLLYLTAGFGIKLLLNNWYAIFPANPVAKNFGLFLVVVIALLASGYDIARYYVAWPKTNELSSAVISEKNA